MIKKENFIESSYELYKEQSELFLFELEKINKKYQGQKFGRRTEHLIRYIEENNMFGDTIYNDYRCYDYILEKLNNYFEVIKDKNTKLEIKYLYNILDYVKTIIECIFIELEKRNKLLELKNRKVNGE